MREKAGLKLNIQKTKAMASSPITSWKMDGEKVETVTVIFLGSRITVDGDCGLEMERYLFLGENTMAKLDNVLKGRASILPKQVCIVKAMVYPVVMYRYDIWTIKKVEAQGIDVFKLWCWRRLLRVP